MVKHKKIMIIIMLGVMIFTSGVFVALDFFRLSLIGTGMEYYQNPYIKRIVLVLCFVLAWITGKDSFDKKDAIRIKILYIAIVMADLCFVFKQSMLGIALFAVCQIILVWRNGSGLFKHEFKDLICKCKVKLIGIAIIILFMMVAVSVFIFYPIFKNSVLFYIIIAYGLLLSLSLWTAISNCILGLFPKINSILVVIGMICFYIGDYCVGIDLALDPGFYWIIVNSLNWIFFTPAIILIALSSYSYKEKIL